MRALFVFLGSLTGALFGGILGLNDAHIQAGAAQTGGLAGFLRGAAVLLIIAVVASVGGVYYLSPDGLKRASKWLTAVIVVEVIAITVIVGATGP